MQCAPVRQTLSKQIYPLISQLYNGCQVKWSDCPRLLSSYKLISEKQNQTSTSLKIDWRQICEKVLEEKRQPNINELSRSEEENHDVDDLFIPLGLVEKKQTRVKWGSEEQGSGFYDPQPEEIVRRFDQANEFFETVIRGERSAQSLPIIVIGEPGAGKTTLLQKIATELPDELLPVWVSLADLRGCDLDQYLFGGTWWADKTLPPETGEEFKELFKTGQVCLLLDGVDEMSVPADQRGLSQLRVIYDQIKGWGDRVRVIMTCRVNVWEADPLFDKFEMYRNLQLAYPEQVEQYIDNFFSKPDLSVSSGEVLKQELRENDRVQDTVKNPLRLALLCHAFQLDRKLPDTQAKLYGMFLEAFYKIKKANFDVEQEALNQALGKLALAALDREQSNYRIDRFIAKEVLGESFFSQAFKLGLLNQIGYVAEDPYQECYAFIHPTFQEYLAACSVKDWHYFLNHVPGNPAQGTYRVFKPQWKNTILLWLSCPNTQIPVQQKEAFMDQLEDFEDDCGGFYKTFLQSLSESCLIHFNSYSRASDILRRLIKKSPWLEKISEINEELVISCLLDNEGILDNNGISILGDLYADTRNKNVIEFLFRLLKQKSKGEEIINEASIRRSIKKVDPDHPDGQIYKMDPNEDDLYLEKITGKKNLLHGKSKRQLVEVLENNIFFSDAEKCDLIKRIISWIEYEEFTNQIEHKAADKDIIIDNLHQVINNSSDEDSRFSAIAILNEFNPEVSDEYIISVLIDMMRSSKNEHTQLRAASILIPYNDSVPDDCSYLFYHLSKRTSQSQKTEAVEQLINIFQDSTDFELLDAHWNELNDLDLNRSDLIRIFSRFLSNTCPDILRAYSCAELVKLDSMWRLKAENILLDLFQNSKDPRVRLNVAQALAEYDEHIEDFVRQICFNLRLFTLDMLFPFLVVLEKILSSKYPLLDITEKKIDYFESEELFWSEFWSLTAQGVLDIFNEKLYFLKWLQEKIKDIKLDIDSENYFGEYIEGRILRLGGD